jgi:hypothetical protein
LIGREFDFEFVTVPRVYFQSIKDLQTQDVINVIKGKRAFDSALQFEVNENEARD